MRDWKYIDQGKLIEEIRAGGLSIKRWLELSTQGPRIEAEIAKSPEAPRELLEKMSQTGKPHVWLSLLLNPALPSACYGFLVGRRESAIDRALALSASTPEETLEKLYSRGQVLTLRALARSPNTPPRLLQQLSNHRDTGVYRAALKNRNNPLYMGGRPWQRFTLNVSTYNIRLGRSLPMLLLERFSRSTQYREQRIAASCPDLTEEMMMTLLQSNSPWLQALIAGHPAITDDVARALARVSNPVVSNALSNNPNASKSKRR